MNRTLGHFLPGKSGKVDEVMAVDLGSRTTKAVRLKKEGGALSLASYAVVDTPHSDRPLTREQLAEHLKNVRAKLNGSPQKVALVMDQQASVLRSVDMPLVPIGHMRSMLRINGKSYLQEEKLDYLFDCFVLPPDGRKTAGKFEDERATARVLAGGVPQASVHELSKAAKSAGLALETITLAALGPVNAFQIALPQVFQNEVIALVDIGLHKTNITIFSKGNLLLHREIKFGGQDLTKALAEAMNVNEAVAEGLKLIMPEKVQSKLESAIAGFGQEIRASLEYFEYTYEQMVGRVFFSGGSARSDFIIQTLQQQLGVPCRQWDPTRMFAIGLEPDQVVGLKADAPQLVTAVGAAVSLFNDSAIKLNLLAEEQQQKSLRWKDPILQTFIFAGAAAVSLLLWAGWEGLRLKNAKAALLQSEEKLASLARQQIENLAVLSDVKTRRGKIQALASFSENRFFWGTVLDGLQFTIPDGVSLSQIQGERLIEKPSGTASGETNKPKQQFYLHLQGKSETKSSGLEAYIGQLAAYSGFPGLAEPGAIRLKEHLEPQVQFVNFKDAPAFSLFALECLLTEKDF